MDTSICLDVRCGWSPCVHVTAVKALVQFIRENLADPPLKFHLCECMPHSQTTWEPVLTMCATVCSDTTPPKQVLRSGRITIAEVRLPHTASDTISFLPTSLYTSLVPRLPPPCARGEEIVCAHKGRSLGVRLPVHPLLPPCDLTPPPHTHTHRLGLYQRPLSTWVRRARGGPCCRHSASRMHSQHCRQRWPTSEGGGDSGELMQAVGHSTHG